MTAADIARLQDGRVAPENVRPRAKNPIIAGFFREIGRADRLGSGVRNLYKYSKDYGGADPVFTEGNNFVISVSLKKLDPIRFPLGKPHIGEGKQPIGTEKPHIGDGKPHIEGLLSGLGLTRPTEENILKLFQRFGESEIFGRPEVRDTTGLQDRASSALIGQMLRHRLLDTVKGHGKGKYRFRSKFPGTNP